jgi:hypothetical protein
MVYVPRSRRSSGWPVGGGGRWSRRRLHRWKLGPTDGGGSGAGQVSVPQASVAPVDADRGGTGGSSGPQVGTVPAVREAGGGAGQGSGPQDVAFPSPTSGRGGSNQTTDCGDGVQGSSGGTEVPVAAVGAGSNGGSVTADLMPTITSSL